MNSRYSYLSATEALRCFRAGEVSPVDAMRALLERAARLSATVNATTAIHRESALAAAHAAQARYRDGVARPLEGLPVAIKEEMSVAGWRKTVGSLLLDEVPTTHHPMVDKLVAAGAIPHIQTTVPEFCLIGQTLSRRFGVTRNPWNLAMTPGGSSGGSGAALAAGLAPLATGSDMGGSIRIPAALCGVYGFKPPFGRLATVPGEELFTFAVDGPMARTFDDLVLMQNAVAGPHPASYTGMPFQPLPATFPSVSGLSIGVAFTTGNGGLCPDTRRNIERACTALELQGATIEPIQLDWDSNQIGSDLIEAIFGLFFEEYLSELPEAALPDGTAYLHWLMDRHRGRRNSILKGARLALALHQELDRKLWSRGLAALVCPTVFTTAIRADLDLTTERSVDIEGRPADSYLGWVGTPPFNLVSRYPVIAAPTGLAGNGMPTSMQIVGPPFGDEMVFRIAAAHARGPGSELYTSVFPPDAEGASSAT